jgi:L-ascorbate metabolism protein UlaG (beta-lactamase superfamily)
VHDYTLEFGGVKFYWLGHDGYRIESGGKTIYIDPYQIPKSQHNRNDADVVLITHNHFDHLSLDDLKHVVGKKTTIVAAKECLSKLGGMNVLETHGVAPGDKISIQDIAVEAIAAYNVNKKFHPKSDGKVGFVFAVNSMRIYHAGDTDEIPEMNDLDPHVAIVPVSGTYVMTAEEAARAVNNRIKPNEVAIPMHYGTIVGTEDDAKKFKELVRVCRVQILERT